MAACRSLQHIFENPLPENPTLLESLSFSQIKPKKPIEQSSFTEIFGELHFKESPDLSFPPPACYSSSSLESVPQKDTVRAPESKSHSKSLRGSESLQLCTEGLGFESSDNVEELKNGMNETWEVLKVKEDIPLGNSSNGQHYGRKSRGSVGETQYPPPISCIGKNGKPWVCFRSYRDNGRFVLKEIRIPTKEFLHAHRENGRLTLNFVQPDDDVLLQEDAEEEEEEEEAENEEDDEEAEEDSGNGESGTNETDQVNVENGVSV
ncbi:protein FANTASTIC FOUR 1 [Neltuma alba]|uniref:protein FANTASTIC FOUR 1-like n=1 Tax=Neltuma alba TaxID=207710 RepID=UPI0010A2D94F|nr:protein FANTASTIC FOUR 1-like [Prosopis alba]XP_028808248.1 protein FANTASTIC FOUR 1 [Prosopis alba]